MSISEAREFVLNGEIDKAEAGYLSIVNSAESAKED